MSSRESTEQGRSGRRGSEATREQGPGRQPPQGSDRVEAAREEREPKHDFAPGRAPSEQGRTDDPSAERIARDQAGLAGSGRGRGGAAAGKERAEAESQRGSPGAEHTRHGRQSMPGDREPAE